MRLDKLPSGVFSDDGTHLLGVLSPDGGLVGLSKSYANLPALLVDYNAGRLVANTLYSAGGVCYLYNGTTLCVQDQTQINYIANLANAIDYQSGIRSKRSTIEKVQVFSGQTYNLLNTQGLPDQPGCVTEINLIGSGISNTALDQAYLIITIDNETTPQYLFLGACGLWNINHLYGINNSNPGAGGSGGVTFISKHLSCNSNGFNSQIIHNYPIPFKRNIKISLAGITGTLNIWGNINYEVNKYYACKLRLNTPGTTPTTPGFSNSSSLNLSTTNQQNRTAQFLNLPANANNSGFIAGFTLGAWGGGGTTYNPNNSLDWGISYLENNPSVYIGNDIAMSGGNTPGTTSIIQPTVGYTGTEDFFDSSFYFGNLPHGPGGGGNNSTQITGSISGNALTITALNGNLQIGQTLTAGNMTTCQLTGGSMAQFQGSVSGNTLSVVSGSVVGTIAIGQTVTVPGGSMTPATITAGSGLSWTLNGSAQNVSGPVPMNSSAWSGNWTISGSPQTVSAGTIFTASFGYTLPGGMNLPHGFISNLQNYQDTNGSWNTGFTAHLDILDQRGGILFDDGCLFTLEGGLAGNSAVFTLTGCTNVSGSSTISLTGITGLTLSYLPYLVGMYIQTGTTGVNNNTYITGYNATTNTITLNAPTTGAVSSSINVGVPGIAGTPIDGANFFWNTWWYQPY